MPVSRTVPKAIAPAPGTSAETQSCIDKRERVLANDFYADLGALMEEGRCQGKV
ncbi:MAG: hypothetical protein Q8M11_18145 [Sulfuritalea sp.]|nr:hypothetical protein [Sulfuritalea sp.]MDP1982645.1 hypothetical protein [Sulfuritalea sp.]